jgi:hypothetical protein
MAGSGLIPSGGGAWNDFARAVGLLAPRPRIRIPVDAPHIPDPDAPRLPAPDAPRLPEPEAPRVPEPDAPRDGRFDGEWEDVNTPWYKNPLNLIPAAMAGGIGWLASMATQDGIDSTNGTADLHAEQAPLPGDARPAGGAGSEAFRAKQAAFRAEQDARRAWLNKRNKIAGGAQNIIGGPSGNTAFWNHMADLSDEDRQAALTSMVPMDRNRALVESTRNQQLIDLGMRAAGGRQQAALNPELAALQAEAAAEELRAARAKNRRADEDILGEKYAKGYILPWWLGGGYDEFTVAEQQDMLDDLMDQGYSLAEAQRAVDRQADKRRASEPARWGDGER